MSQDLIEGYKKDIQGLKEQVEVVSAQFEAAKQMYNEGLNASLNLRAANVLAQKKIEALLAELKAFKDSQKDSPQPISKKVNSM